MLTRAHRLNHSVALTIAIFLAGTTFAAVPILHDEPFHGSPVRGYSDDIVFITGSGFVAGARVQVGLPGDDPATLLNPATIVLVSDDSITVRLPSGTTTLDSTDPIRALWVKNGGGEQSWAGPVLLNDLRPLWLSPSHQLTTGTLNGLPRTVTVVGRNLHLVSDVKIENGSNSYEFSIGSPPSCASANYGESALDSEAVSIDIPLPDPMATGVYDVFVKRTCGTWVQVADNSLTIDAPTTPTTYAVASYGCEADDSGDDTQCVLDAIADAKVSGGEVFFGAGEWLLDERYADLCNPSCPDMTAEDGILVPEDVDLIGNGRTSTKITIGKTELWDSEVVFTLLGSNRVEGIHFHDKTVEKAIEAEFNITWPPTDTLNLPIRVGQPPYVEGEHFHIGFKPRAVLRLGRRPQDVSQELPVDDVAIVDNEFESPVIAILDGGFAMSRVIIAGNKIQAFRDGIRFTSVAEAELDADDALFGFADSVIYDNEFHDSAYSGTIEGGQVEPDKGVIAFQIGASERVQVTHNTVDGCADTPGQGCSAAEGFRAGFFWSMHGNHEMLLVEDNDFIQIGRKSGDGEAAAIDINKTRYLFEEAATVFSATESEITVALSANPVLDEQAIEDMVYRDHWIQIGDGTGVGQTRKISSYTFEKKSGAISKVTFTVSPDFETAPDTSSIITVHRQTWHAYFSDNSVDATPNDSTDCDPGIISPTTKAGQIRTGLLHFYSATSDSLMLNNSMTCTEGIWLATAYNPYDPQGELSQRMIYNTAIIDNWIERDSKEAFDWDHTFYTDAEDCTNTGNPPKPRYAEISGGIRISANSAHDSPTLLYGVSVNGNSIDDAAVMANPCGSTFTGAINVEVFAAANPDTPRQVRNTMIWDNEIDLSGIFDTDPSDSSIDTFDYLRTVLIERGCNVNRPQQIEGTVLCNDDSLTIRPSGTIRPTIYNEDSDTVDCDGNADLDYCWCSSCSGNAACDDRTSICVAPCADNDDCASNEVCNTSTDVCVECVDDDDCASDEVCDTSAAVCVECLEDIDCASNQVCDTSTTVCVECVDDDDCTGSEGVCDGASNECVECLNNDDCDPGDVCRLNGNECVFGCANDGECGPGGVCVKDFGEPLGFCL